MEVPKPYISLEHSSRRHYQPVICLILWAIALNGNPARELLKALGVEQAEVESMTDGMEPELAEMRQLRMVAELFDRERLGQLLRARLAEMLMQCHRPGELAQLAKAAQRLPAWAFDGNAAAVGDAAHNNKRARTQAGAQAHTPARNAQTRAGGHNGAPTQPAPDSGLDLTKATPICDKLVVEDVEDQDAEFPLGVKENGEPYTAVELVGELNAMLDEVQRLDDAKAQIEGFNKMDHQAFIEQFSGPVDIQAALRGDGDAAPALEAPAALDAPGEDKS
jgi:hypothetical protein